MQNHEEDWTIKEAPLIFIEMVHRGDVVTIDSLMDFSFDKHYYISRNQATTFFRNKEVTEKAKEVGYHKYKDPNFVKKILKLTIEIEDKLRKTTDKFNEDLTAKTNEELYGLLKEFYDIFSYFAGVYRITRPSFYDKVIEEIKSRLPEPKNENLNLVLSNDFGKLSFDLDQEVKELVISLKKTGQRRLKLHDVYLYSFIGAGKLFREIGERVGLSVLEVKNCLLRELKELLLSKQEAKKRAEYFKFTYTNDSFKITTEKEDNLENYSNITELKGQTAHPGYAKARVNFVRETLNGPILEDIQNFQEGSILVTRTTSPDMVPAIQKAGAIVTDQGGMLSHAAIISREFGVPCVIGTKIATKVLQQNDLVEVDAEKGIVKRIK
jgi:phosphoenolpyruvate synthase/pyruvate phosphate dikinase